MAKAREETKLRILDAALAEFSEKGPDGARVNLIAQRANINKERLYAYFSSKDGLFAAVLQRVFTEMAALDEGLLAIGADRLPELPELLVLHNLRTHHQQPHLWRLLAWENLCGGQHLEVIRDFHSRGYDHLRQLFELGQERGLFRQEIPFESFLLMAVSVPYFCFSNRLTMSRTLSLDLADSNWQNRLAKEFSAMVSLGEE